MSGRRQLIVDAAMLADPPALSAHLMHLVEEHGFPLTVSFVVPDWSKETVGEAYGLSPEKQPKSGS